MSASYDHGPARVAGVVEHVKFHNEENGWTALVVMSPEHGEVQMVGNLSEKPTPDSTVEAEGRWTNHARFGRQFTCTKLDVKMPEGSEGLVRYLADTIDGLGPAIAARLVAHFGDDAKEALADPERLARVRGISKKTAEKIARQWNERASEREAMIFLRNLGFGQSQALRVVRKFGSAWVRQAIEENPYRLTEIGGIGFKTADDVGSRLGIPRDSPFRIKAGIRHTLEERSSQGHTSATPQRLADEASKILELTPGEVSAHFDGAVREAMMNERLVGGSLDNVVYLLPRLDAAEKSLASDVRRLMRAPSTIKVPRIDWDEIKNLFGFAPDDSQREAIQMALREPVSIITGGPGMGKTSLVLIVVHLFEKILDIPVYLCSPTGRAAKRLAEATRSEASTIHRYLGVEPNPMGGGFRFVHNRERPVDRGLVVADEISMLDVTLGSNVFEALPDGMRFLGVGDADQLPSVGAGNVLADMIAGGVPYTRLSHIHRTGAGSPIPMIAKAIIEGFPPALTSRGDARGVRAASSDGVVRTISEMVASGISFDDIQVLAPMRKGDMGTEWLNIRLQAVLNPRGMAGRTMPTGRKVKNGNVNGVARDVIEVFAIGDRVMQTKNNYDLDVFNGDLFTVLDFSPAEETKNRWMLLRRQDDGVEVRIPWENFSTVQIAYASTIHKAQGSQYPHVVLVLTPAHYVMLNRRLVYTAITRAQKTLTIVGDSKAIQLACQDVGGVPARDTGLVELLLAA